MLYLIIFLLSFGLTFIIKEIAKKKLLMDIPNERSSHAVPTPRGGGLAIAIAWFVGISVLYAFKQMPQELYYALLPGVLICAISFLDDIITLKSMPRMAVQALAVILALYSLGGLQAISVMGFSFGIAPVLNVLVFVGMIWFINLFNFIDGIDGYAGSEAVFVSLAFYFFTGEKYALIMTFAALGFMPWNWQKAKIFMGDVGSTLLGFSIIVLAVYFHNTSKIQLLDSLLLSALFWFDATITLFRRYKNAESLSQAHRKHAYQRLVQAGFSHQKTVIGGMLINLILFALVFFSGQYQSLALVFFTLGMLVLYLAMKLIDKKKPFLYNKNQV